MQRLYTALGVIVASARLSLIFGVSIRFFGCFVFGFVRKI